MSDDRQKLSGAARAVDLARSARALRDAGPGHEAAVQVLVDLAVMWLAKDGVTSPWVRSTLRAALGMEYGPSDLEELELKAPGEIPALSGVFDGPDGD